MLPRCGSISAAQRLGGPPPAPRRPATARRWPAGRVRRRGPGYRRVEDHSLDSVADEVRQVASPPPDDRQASGQAPRRRPCRTGPPASWARRHEDVGARVEAAGGGAGRQAARVEHPARPASRLRPRPRPTDGGTACRAGPDARGVVGAMRHLRSGSSASRPAQVASRWSARAVVPAAVDRGPGCARWAHGATSQAAMLSTSRTSPWARVKGSGHSRTGTNSTSASCGHPPVRQGGSGRGSRR